MDRQPHLAIIFQEPMSAAVFDNFRLDIDADGLDLYLESTPKPGAFAGLEWLMPTAVMLFITQGYFNGFLGEAGKDHYQSLKAGIKTLSARFRKVQVTLVGTKGKVSAIQPYSLVFSLWLTVDDGLTFKFLIPIDVPEPDADVAIEAFLNFAEALVSGSLSESDAAELATTKRYGSIILLVFNPSSGRIEILDPIPAGLGDRR